MPSEVIGVLASRMKASLLAGNVSFEETVCAASCHAASSSRRHNAAWRQRLLGFPFLEWAIRLVEWAPRLR
jgi:hypothetical protein